jgi:hypothetical protein
MDRDEALKLLTGGPNGIAEWNRRRQAGEEIPDLNRAALSETDLRTANLRGASLYEANLSRANLSEANLREANLGWAYLREANLSGAKLVGADLIAADLIAANLREADLIRANLFGAKLVGAELNGAGLYEANLNRANLSGANLSGAECHGTTFADVDLSEVKGLASVYHLGPCTIGIDSLFRSKGDIPEAFLRGCGVPETLITYLPSIMSATQPIQFYSCFISYASKDQAFAERLYADLLGKGIRCWYAPEDLKIGEKIRVGIDDSIRVHDKLLLVLSKNSVRSQWVEKEVETAMEKERKQERTVLFPIRLDDSVMKIESGWPADIRRSRNIGEFRRWKDHDSYQRAFARLLRDLKAEKPTSPDAPSPRATRRKKPR